MTDAPAFSAATPSRAPTKSAADLRWFVYVLFFVFGGITSLNDVLAPKLKELFSLNYTEAMLVQFSFFAAYFLVSSPAAAVVQRVGYMRGAVLGLGAMTLGCLLFIPASLTGFFPAFLLALFVLAAGVTTVQVVVNPLISLLGPPETTSSRLTFAQAFNSFGTTVFPYVGAILILGSLAKVDVKSLSGAALGVYRQRETQVIVTTYIGLAMVLIALATLVWRSRDRLHETPAPRTLTPDGGVLQAFDLLKQPRVLFGTLAIFVYVGAEVSIGSMITNYLMRPDTLGLAAQQAGKLVSLYWACAMVGRFCGAEILRRASAGLVLAAAAVGAGSLIVLSANVDGLVSGVAILAIGLCNSIMFPTIFSLSSEGLGPRSAEASGLICMAIVGGAIVPLVTGHVADLGGLKVALAVPFSCYVAITGFGLFCHHSPVAAAKLHTPVAEVS